MTTDLIKAIWASGWRAGHESGSDAAFAYGWGSRSDKPQNPESAWAEDIQWRLDTEGYYKLEMENPQSWNHVP